uniref:Homeobox domain-containing protein n=1 Tax=Gasterosteus aculeatus aculeatus TaxID=481459 RepID=G3NYF5_GASAC
MSFRGFIFPPSVSLSLSPPFGTRVLLGPRPEELGRSSSGSAFAPYSGSGSSPGFSSHLPRSLLPVFQSPGYNPSSGVSGSLDYHPSTTLGALGPYAYGEPSYRKNATRDATATLKAWLNEHRKNPYPTKGEKIMLAIITKMTLTQVSTWFANARRRLKKENKMTWTPRNRSEDEEEEDHVELERNDEDKETVKVSEDSSDTDRSFTDPDFKNSGNQRLALVPGPASTAHPPQTSPTGSFVGPQQEHKEPVDLIRGSNPKPKLWSLAEIATSSDKQKRPSDTSQTQFPHSPVLARNLYTTSSFLPRYPGFGSLGAPQGGSHLNGLHHTMLQLKELCRERTLELSHLIRIVTSNTNVMINNVDSYLNEWF